MNENQIEVELLKTDKLMDNASSLLDNFEKGQEMVKERQWKIRDKMNDAVSDLLIQINKRTANNFDLEEQQDSLDKTISEFRKYGKTFRKGDIDFYDGIIQNVKEANGIK